MGKGLRRAFHRIQNTGVALSVTAVALVAIPSLATAAVTIGQTGSMASSCEDNMDRLQPTVTSGNAYLVPSTGGISNWTVTSWSTPAGPQAGQMLAMKVYRPLGGLTYTVVGHDGPHLLAPSTLNTFPASVAVQAGDVLGLSTPSDGGLPPCRFAADGHLSYTGNLADGQSGQFAPGGMNGRLNVSAVIAPTNSFKLGDVDRNKRKGTATVTVNVPNPGELTGSGNGVSTAGAALISRAVSAPGEVQLLIQARGKKKTKLNRKGKVKVSPTITYTPTGGDPSSQSIDVKLKKKLKKR
jgi:hypothetical protein